MLPVVITEKMSVVQFYIPQSLRLCFRQTFLSMSPECRRQIAHPVMGMEGEKSMGYIRTEGASAGSNSCYLCFVIEI